MKKGFILGFILGITCIATAQNRNIKEIKKQVLPQEIRLDLSTSYYHSILSNTLNYKSVNHLTFANSNKNKNLNPDLIYNTERINILEADNLSKNDFAQLIIMMKNILAINTLIIRSTKIDNIPIEFIFDKGIKTLIVDNCKTLNPTTLNNVFSQHTFLKTLRINNCEIYSIDYVFPIQKFNVIDLRNNHLSSAGEKLSQIKTLDSIYISGNFIPDALNDLMNFTSDRIKYIETDSISVAAHTKLREANKNAHWNFVPSETLEDKVPKKVFGQFSINTSKYKVYSSAYIQYDRLFSNAQFNINLDTASLEEVFWDTLNLLSRQTPIALNNKIFRLYKEKNRVRRHITFGFNRNKKGINLNYYSYARSTFFKTHPEMNIYKKYVWITEEEMSSKNFKHFSRMNYVDLRLVYDGVGKSYTLYLKKIDGKIIQLKVFPVKGKNKKRNNNYRYDADYARYITTLSKINRRHDKDISRNKRMVYVSIERAKRNAWNTLRTYMSPTEREMTKEEWMNYYYELVKYEETALLSAYPKEDLLQRKLRKMGFSYRGTNTDTVGLAIISVFFTDDDNSNIPVTKLLVLNKSRMTYRFIYPTSFFNSINLTLYKNDDVAILVFLPDKSVGLATIDEIEPSIINSVNNRIKSQIVDSELITIGQILKKFDL